MHFSIFISFWIPGDVYMIFEHLLSSVLIIYFMCCTYYKFCIYFTLLRCPLFLYSFVKQTIIGLLVVSYNNRRGHM